MLLKCLQLQGTKLTREAMFMHSTTHHTWFLNGPSSPEIKNFVTSHSSRYVRITEILSQEGCTTQVLINHTARTHSLLSVVDGHSRFEKLSVSRWHGWTNFTSIQVTSKSTDSVTSTTQEMILEGNVIDECTGKKNPKRMVESTGRNNRRQLNDNVKKVWYKTCHKFHSRLL